MLAERSGEEASGYLLEQRFRYTYATPVRRLRHRLMVVPPAVHGGQHRIDHGLTASGDPVLMSVAPDAFANHVVKVRADAVTAWVEFDAWALVARRGTAGISLLRPAALCDRRLLAPTTLTEVEGDLAEVARGLAGATNGSGRGLDLAERACTWAHRSLTYEYGITGVRTTAAAALAGGRGVCQDYAHIMLALCRAAGLPCRYVSGHLVGEGGSHAWVEVVVADPAPSGPRRAMAVAFDPTHDRRAGDGYLTVAVGRDYRDVAPTSGTFDGKGPGVLSARKRLSVVDSVMDGAAAAASR